MTSQENRQSCPETSPDRNVEVSMGGSMRESACMTPENKSRAKELMDRFGLEQPMHLATAMRISMDAAARLLVFIEEERTHEKE